MILSQSNIEETLRISKGLSVLQLEKLLNARIASRIRFLCTGLEPDFWKEKLAEYRRYYDSGKRKWTEIQIYTEFLTWLEVRWPECDFEATRQAAQKGLLDIYDAAAFALIWKRILVKKDTDEFSQIIIDEAQDFGEMIYYVLKQILTDCYFMVMGDVSQNIHYETGMNDWEGLKEALFEQKKDSFYLLAKSYRNTIEISECAGRVLEKASQGSYKIQPVIRHGKEVDVRKVQTEQMEDTLKETLREVESQGYETIAVVCRTEEEADEVRTMLGMQKETEGFKNGVMVLPVSLTKGLKFDAVILWRPDNEHYGANPREAKLLYVAITRALHELHLIVDREISACFD